MQIINSFKYSLKVWVLGIILPPSFLITLSLFVNTSSFSDWFIVGLILKYSIVLSIPSFLILVWVTNLLSDKNKSIQNLKFKLTFIGLLLTCLAFLLFKLIEMDASQFDIIIPAYMASIILGIWVFSLNTQRELTE